MTRPCRHCAGTGEEPVPSEDMPFEAIMTVHNRWETVRDLVTPPVVGQIAVLAGTTQRLQWDGEGWVGLPDPVDYVDPTDPDLFDTAPKLRELAAQPRRFHRDCE